MLNRAIINKALRAKGYCDELCCGGGYWYFSGQDASQFPQSSVYVYRLNDLSFEQWIEAYESLRRQWERGE